MGLKIGLDFSGTSNHCFWHYSPIYLSKLAQKPHISTQFDEIYLLVRDLTKTDGKKICPIFNFFGSIQLKIQWENVFILCNFALK